MSDRPEAPYRKPAHRAPYGLSFAVEELTSIQFWADQADFRLAIILDQVSDGVEFEEMLVLHENSGRKRSVTLWRTASSVILQAPHCRPAPYRTVRDALASIRIKAPGRPARRWL